MSHSSSSTQPLSDILPWGSPITVLPPSSSSSSSTYSAVSVDDRTLLITDACSSDGRFMLHALALQFLLCGHHVSLLSRSAAAHLTAVDKDAAHISPVLEGAVLWISCNPVIDRQIITGLRKASQHDLGGRINGASGLASGFADRIRIVSVQLELADATLDGNGETGAAASFSHEQYLKGLHRRIVHWLNHRELIQMAPARRKIRENCVTHGPNLIIIDSATALATLCGDKLTSMFLLSVRSSMRHHSLSCSSSIIDAKVLNSNMDRKDKFESAISTVNLLAIRVSSPDDGLCHVDSERTRAETIQLENARLLRPWLGFGSGPSTNGNEDVIRSISLLEEQCNSLSLTCDSVPSLLYRSGINEIADGIVDISPLESGYARDVNGRLSCGATWKGKGWWGIGGSSGGITRSGNATPNEGSAGAYTSICVNYRCDDSGVRVMRLRSR